MIFHSLSIAGANAAVALTTGYPGYPNSLPYGSLQAKWVSLSAVGGIVLIGGSEVSAAVGYPIPAGGGQFNPPVAIDTDFYDLSKIIAYIPTGATLNILYGG